MIEHIVLIRTENIEMLNQALELVKSLPGKIEGLNNVEIGKNFTDRAKGFNHLFIMTFADNVALKNWSEHPLHIPIRNILMSIAEMIVFDYKK